MPVTDPDRKVKQTGAASRMDDIAPFYVMDVLARAKELEAGGRSIVHMEVGEPDFPSAEPIVQAGKRALDRGYTHYTPALGIPELRRAIADYYGERYGITVAPERVVVTPGASGALQLAMGVLVNPGDAVILADPGYPCNRHIVRMFEGRPVNVPIGADSQYQLTPEMVASHVSAGGRAVMLASPSNPTGTLVPPDALAGILQMTRALGAHVIVDEIYHGLVYGTPAMTALSLSEHAFVVNSFSKYFGMTGWRLGWLVAPERWVRHMEKLAQNIFLAPPTVAQHAALAAFRPETIAMLEDRRRQFQARRDYLLPALRELGFDVDVEPQGAFYIYAGCEAFTDDSQRFAMEVLERTGVAITPGLDFGTHAAHRHVRFAYTTGIDDLKPKSVTKRTNYF